MTAETTLVELLRSHALRQGGKPAFTFLPDGEKEQGSLTFAQLDQRARAIGAYLQARRMQGKPVLLLFPSGLDFIAAFAGCLYAGAIPTPAHVPRLNRNLSRLRMLAADAKPEVAFTTDTVFDRIQPMLVEAGLKVLSWVTTGEVSEELAGSWCEPQITQDTLALLQYTSGSTSAPKGIMVSHGNLIANHRMIERAFEHTHDSTFVTWLPLFHDMGLIGTVLQVIYLGSHCVLMPPECFLVKPLRWLQSISRYKAHTTGAPNFAYDLCCRRVTAEQREQLDLSHWQVAFNGSEPVRAQTLKNFTETFATCGFRATTFYPCYGLAEATLFVSGATKSSEPVTASFAGDSLQHGKAVEADGELSRTFVSCGYGWLEQEIVIVDPETKQRCADGAIGEIWVKGPNVAQGFWKQPELTSRHFKAYLFDSNDGPFLRTGDAGFFHKGELYIAGRLKDLIIIAGRNHDPADIEQTVETSHPGIRPGCCAAFSIDFGGDEKLVVLAELHQHETQTKAITDAVRRSVAENHDLSIHALEFLLPARIPKTSSGKIQRHLCRARYLAGSLHTQEI